MAFNIGTINNILIRENHSLVNNHDNYIVYYNGYAMIVNRHVMFETIDL